MLITPLISAGVIYQRLEQMRRRNVNPLTCCIDWSLDLLSTCEASQTHPGQLSPHTSHFTRGLDVAAGLEHIRHQTTGALIEETRMAIFIFTLTWVLQPELKQLFKLGLNLPWSSLDDLVLSLFVINKPKPILF